MVCLYSCDVLKPLKICTGTEYTCGLSLTAFTESVSLPSYVGLTAPYS